MPNFQHPPRKVILQTYGAGILTAILLIGGLEVFSRFFLEPDTAKATLKQSVAKESVVPAVEEPKDAPKVKHAREDAASIRLPGKRVPSTQAVNSLPLAALEGELSSVELEIANKAWNYFKRNLSPENGMVNSVDGFNSVTLWDQSAAIAAVVSAKELELISEQEFNTTLEKMLVTLAKLPLYKNELPNKVYNSKTLIPVSYGQVDKKEEIGWSAIDIGRIALWLKIIAAKYPQFKPQTEQVWNAWKVDRLTKDGNMYGTHFAEGVEQYNQEGRLGYENYAAYGLKLWGLDVSNALDAEDKASFVELYGHSIPFDMRDAENSEANNYVLSEPFFLDGMETGFKALPKLYADNILAAQEGRYKETKQLTAITEDNLDREPYFLYNTLYVNGKPWSTINDLGENYNHLRFVSSKAAIGLHVLYGTDYTQKLFDFVHQNLGTDSGWYSGYYETLEEPNAVLTANNNGIILESLLYRKVGKPLTQWAGVSP